MKRFVMAGIITLLSIILIIGILNYGNGKIVDVETGKPIEGATIFIEKSYCVIDSCHKGYQMIVKTRKNGKYQSVPAKNKVKDIIIENFIYIFPFGGYSSSSYFIFKQGYVPLWSIDKDSSLVKYGDSEELLINEKYIWMLRTELKKVSLGYSNEICPSQDVNIINYCSHVVKVGSSFDECSKILKDNSFCEKSFAQMENKKGFSNYTLNYHN